MYALVDCNNFYCSCERLFNPKLTGIPVVVLSNNDGCVIARSNEAKALGIKMGTPYFMLEKFMKEHGVAVYSSNYVLYGDISERVQSTLATFTPEIEYYSIDESFLNFNGFYFTDLNEYMTTIRNTVIRNTGIPVSIGVAPTKTLSKLANKLAKKSQTGYLILDTEDNIKQALACFPIEDLWGIGSQYERKLKQHGINTAFDLVRQTEEWIYKGMTVKGLRMVKELKGIPCHEMEITPSRKKAMCSAKAFGKSVENYDELREAVTAYASRIGEKLRKDNSAANILTVFVHTNPFKLEIEQYSGFKNIKLPVPTNSTREIVKYALQGLRMIYKKGYKYHKAGVMVSGIVPAEQIQSNMFDSFDRTEDIRINKVMDTLNSRFGRGTLKLASEGFSKKWSMKQANLSKCYTTRWEDIIEVR